MNHVSGGANYFLHGLKNLSSGQIVEGALWSCALGSTFWDWTQAIQSFESNGENCPLSAAERASHIWKFAKHSFLEGAAAIGAFNCCILWAAKSNLIFIGSMFPYFRIGAELLVPSVACCQIWKVWRGDEGFSSKFNEIVFNVSLIAMSVILRMAPNGERPPIKGAFCYFGVSLICLNLVGLILRDLTGHQPNS